MHSTRSLAGQTLSCIPAIFGVLALFFLSACGLAMDNEDRLARGEQALADGDQRAAIIDAKDVLLKEPDNVRARLLLGRASVVAGDGAGAEKDLRRALELGAELTDVAVDLGQALVMQIKFQEVLDEIPTEGLPDDDARAAALRIHGDASLGLGESESARELYTEALQLRPDDIDAQLGIATTHIADGNFAQARGAVEHVIQDNADNPRAWLYSGSFNTRMREFELAEANYRAALDLADAQAETSSRILALAGLAESLLEQDKTDEGREYVEALENAAPNGFRTRLLVARVATLDKDWTTAQQNLQQLLQVAPDYRPAQLLLGAVHLESGNLSQAEMYLSSALASAQDDVRARQLLARTYVAMDKADEAQDVLRPISDSEDADPLTLQMAARTSLMQQDIDEAVKLLRRSVEQSPDNADLKFQLAATLLEVGRTEEAQAVLETIDVSGSEENTYRKEALGVLMALRDGQAGPALKIAERVVNSYPARAGAHSVLGVVQLTNRDLESARKSFERALEIDESHLLARRYLAAIAEATRDFDTAINQYEYILSQAPDATWALYARGRVAARHDDFQLAAESFRRALELEPENENFRLGLAKIEQRMGNSAEAANLLGEDIESVLEHIPSAIMLTLLKAEAGDIDAANEIAAKLFERYPDSPAPYALKGELSIRAEDLASADLSYDKAVELGPLRAHVIRSYLIKRDLGSTNAQQPLRKFLEVRPLDNQMWNLMAESYMHTREYGKAAAAYERVVEGNPQDATALNNLAWTYYVTEDSRALGMAQQAFDLDPENGSIVDTLAWIQVHVGSLEEGEALLRKAVELEDGRAEIRYHHAYALAKLGRNDESRAILEEILAAEETFGSRADAEKLLAEL